MCLEILPREKKGPATGNQRVHHPSLVKRGDGCLCVPPGRRRGGGRLTLAGREQRLALDPKRSPAVGTIRVGESPPFTGLTAVIRRRAGTAHHMVLIGTNWELSTFHRRRHATWNDDNGCIITGRYLNISVPILRGRPSPPPDLPLNGVALQSCGIQVVAHFFLRPVLRGDHWVDT